MAIAILNVLGYIYDFVTVTMDAVIHAFVTPLRLLIAELLADSNINPWLSDVLQSIANSTFNTNLTLLEICLFGVVSYVVVANLVKFILSIFRG